MTVGRPSSIDRARRAKAETLAKLDSMQMLLGAILLRTGPITFDQPEIEAMDPRRLVIVQLNGKVVVGLKDTGEQPLELTALRDRALADVSEEPAP